MPVLFTSLIYKSNACATTFRQTYHVCSTEKKKKNQKMIDYLATYYPANHHPNYKIRGNIIHNNHALPFT